MLAMFQLRAISEKKELDFKLESLLSFIQTEDCLNLSMEERSRLLQQSLLMREYARVLGERIANF
jgi:hypothetical protein